MKLVRYINKNDYNKFLNHENNILQLIMDSAGEGGFRPNTTMNKDYKITIEIEENK